MSTIKDVDNTLNLIESFGANLIRDVMSYRKKVFYDFLKEDEYRRNHSNDLEKIHGHSKELQGLFDQLSLQVKELEFESINVLDAAKKEFLDELPKRFKLFEHYIKQGY